MELIPELLHKNPTFKEWFTKLDQDRAITLEMVQNATCYSTYAQFALPIPHNVASALHAGNVVVMSSESHTLFVPNHFIGSIVLGTVCTLRCPISRATRPRVNREKEAIRRFTYYS